MDEQNLFKQPCYGLTAEQKRDFLLPRLAELTEHHRRFCEPYQRVLDALDLTVKPQGVDQVPFLPVRLFKSHSLMSVAEEEIIKTLTSSGTTSQRVSRIFLDANTARNQTRALVAIMQDFIGKQRLPMLIVDHPGVIKNRDEFSARGAGILGLSTFGRDHTYLLDESMAIDFDRLGAFLEKYQGKPILMFGFTFMVWRYLYQALKATDKRIDLSSVYLVHSGGWKKLADEAVDNDTFKTSLKELTGLERISNFYGMVEQVGAIYMECAYGHLHAPIFSDVLIRDPNSWAPLAIGQEGVVEVLSILPESYPGHALLTEDMGVLLGEDDCLCGRLGKYFRVNGRIPMAELRGCSDTHAESAIEGERQ